MAKDCRTVVHNLSDTTYEQQYDNTAQWYYPNNGYDASWYSSDQTGWATIPAASTNTTTCADSTNIHTAQEQQSPAIHLVAALDYKMPSTPTASTLQSVQQDENKVDIMIDSGAETHVCPPWFAPNTPMHNLEHGQGPQLRTATDENIPAYGYTWVLMTNVNKQQLYSCFLLCARSDTTHLVSSNTGRTRVQHTTQRDTNSLTHTHKGIQLSTCST